jgi:hypothetical protein
VAFDPSSFLNDIIFPQKIANLSKNTKTTEKNQNPRKKTLKKPANNLLKTLQKFEKNLKNRDYEKL